MKSIFKIKLLAAILFMISAAQVSFVSCSDDPGAENYYTYTGEYASDYLANRDQFSEFTQIVQRANNTLSLLGTYGSYTVFAPTNDAIDAYLAGRGLTSVDELSDEDCDTIAYNHIIEQAFYTTDYSDGTYPVLNMLDLPLTITCDSDTVTTPGTILLSLMINKTAEITHADDSVRNGVVHTLSSVIDATTDMLPDLLAEDSTISIFYEALVATGMSDSLLKYKDESYSVGSDSVDWTNDALVMHTASEYDNVAYMETRYYKFTAFIEPNSVYNNYGIYDLDDLKEYAAQLYDPMYPEDADVEDITDRRNSLNRFVSYHLLNRLGNYYSLTCVDGGNNTLANNFNRRRWDIADWYETMMPYSILKCSYPSGTDVGLYINRRGVQSRADSRGYFVRGAKVTAPSDMPENTALNGIYHYIDDIIAYDENTQTVVLNERLRIDCSTLSPDFMTSGARGHYTNSSNENGKYGTWDSTSDHTNKQTCLGFKPGSAENFEFTSATHLHVRPRTLSFWSYQGDEVTIKGQYDFTVKLPPVPEGDYELRFFTCVNFSSRGIVQFYLDDSPCGIPFDMRPDGTEYGWQSDTSLGDDEAITAFDKSFHNLGWMKGPRAYTTGSSESTGGGGTCMRDGSNMLRRVITTFHSDGQSYHYLRCQQKLESTENEMNFDMIELCPSSVYNNEYYTEDKW